MLIQFKREEVKTIWDYISIVISFTNLKGNDLIKKIFG